MSSPTSPSRLIVVVVVVVAAALPLGTIASPTPHQGHHGFPANEFNSTVIHSNQSHPTVHGSNAHSHSGHGSPLLVLNETQVLQGHGPDPLSYLAYDFLNERQGYKSGFGEDAYDIVLYTGTSHGWLILWHILATTAAFFIALPASVALRSAKHPLQPVAHSVFVTLLLIGWLCAAAYRKVTPDLYASSSHSPLGTFLSLTILAVSAAEYVPKIVVFSRGFFAYVQRISERGGSIGKREVIDAIRVGRGVKSPQPPQHAGPDYESARLMDLTNDGASNEVLFEAGEWANEPAPIVPEGEPSGSGSSSPRHHPHPRHHVTRGHRHWMAPSHSRQLSIHSDVSDATTLRNISPTSMDGKWSSDDVREEDEELQHAFQVHSETDRLSTRGGPLRRVACGVLRSGAVVHHIWERLLLVFGYIAFVTGTVVYTGICRGYYLNGCLAHLIKGSIFFLYGLVTFARYIGAFADKGWAWNCLPVIKRNGKIWTPPSAELVESSIIFFYGATNTWMERFGAEPGSPYTAKQIQHISIAVMYFFGGTIGIALELGLQFKRRKDAELSSRRDTAPQHDVQAYRGSYNPFAALCIGITGIAMAAHHQTYLFQVEIHTLWGGLLGMYAVARCMTYLILWINPPRSTEASRPPSEALASFLLTGGGLAFISSTEQIGFWAMRSGRDDVMMFANVIVALSFLCFTWAFGVLAFRSWVFSRMVAAPTRISDRNDRTSDTSRSPLHLHHTGEYEMGPSRKMKAKEVDV